MRYDNREFYRENYLKYNRKTVVSLDKFLLIPLLVFSKKIVLIFTLVEEVFIREKCSITPHPKGKETFWLLATDSTSMHE